MKDLVSLVLLVMTLACNHAVASGQVPAFKIEALADDVFLHTSYRDIKGYGVLDSNGLIVIDGDAAYLVDTPWSEEDTARLLAWLTQRGYELKASVSTHWHDDRTAGIGLLNSKKIPTYASRLTNRVLREKELPLATHVFDSEVFTLLEDRIELFYPGPGHSEDNIVAWLPRQKLLFGGCLLRAMGWKSAGNLSDANLGEWGNSIRRIENRYPEIHLVVPGHGEPGREQMMEHTFSIVTAASKKR